MKQYNKLFVFIIILYICLISITGYLLSNSFKEEQNYYKIEAKRISDEISLNSQIDLSEIDLNKYPHITGVYTSDNDDIYESNNPYVISKIHNKIYRIEYKKPSFYHIIARIILLLLCFMGFSIILMIIIKRQIIKPLDDINQVTRDLAKGNLAVNIPLQKNRYLSDFVWAINMLKDTLTDTRNKELSTQKNQKIMILSLSHDLKTPLSSIKLNAKALEKRLYTDESKRLECIQSISERANEIEGFINQIINTSNQNTINHDLNIKEVFIKDIMDKVYNHYYKQLNDQGTTFTVSQYKNYLLSCDDYKLYECLCNIIENAIKYGDGDKIAITFELMDGYQLINISNTGCNLPPNELNRIFKNFIRGSNSNNIPGNGLGLFICKDLMHRMNGDAYASIKDNLFIATLVVRLC